ncbi:MAG: glycosyltransferase family 4 protein [Chroococcus sp. CMT-3BRIN-NPC107]|jgi:glycosyltransferase involved in cell wall biosynthesis|nr:glycosyltransferase family 4 protein [Chroococcus sp. CMT-3BRIN-NPC107]
MEKQRTVAFILKRVDCNDGVASHCESLIRSLKAVGWKVVLITGAVHCDEGSVRRLEALKDLSEEWVILDDLKPLIPALNHITRINELVKKHQICLFHAHGYTMLVLARILKITTGVNCVATFHPSLHGDNPTSLKEANLRPQIIKYLIFLNLFAPRAFIALSSDIEKFLMKDLGFNKTKVRKILPGIDPQYFRPPTLEERQQVREKFGFKEQDLVCSLVGRLNWNKGHDILIDAVRKARNAAPEISLKGLFVGSGAQEEQIKKYAFANKDDYCSFIFLGYVDDLKEVYWASDIFTLPSRLEGFALVVAEAMYCGTVPIRTPGGGALDQIQEGKTGYTVPFDDAEALSKAIQKLANQDFRLQMGKQCAEYASSAFDGELMIEKTVALYYECSGMKTK